jgi:phage baseplate assembly protein V
MSFVNDLLRRVTRWRLDTSTPGVQADVEILADEPRRDLEVAESYGFTAAPPVDVTEGVALFFGGDSDHGMVLTWLDKTYRPRHLKAGEVALYSQHGQMMLLDKDGRVSINDKAGSMVVMDGVGGISLSPAGGIVTVNGALHATGDVKAGAISLQNHTHPQNSGNHFGGGASTGVAQ